MKKLYCEYCGALLEEGCGCHKELQREHNDHMIDVEELQMMNSYQDDLIGSYRSEQ